MSSERFDARMLCFVMLFEVYERGGYAQLVLKQYFKKYPNAGSRDKSFVTALFYGVITRTYTLDHLIERKIKGNVDTLDPFTRTALRMGVWQIIYSDSIPNYAA
ncbi:MAG: hypothetical protein JW780_04955, partial [Clostridiales bacterium]|nr:hypothetical protein [Clostridiales bacterium]